MTVDAPIDRYAVAGNPVAHSQSPFIHAEYAAQTGQALRYERLLCPLDAFAPTLRAFAAGGGRGCNVTVPFKFEAFAMAQRLSPRARLAGAVNTLRFDEDAAGGWFGDNTDGAGLVRDIEANAGRPLAGQRILLLGAGGASAGVLGSLIKARPAEICLANRSLDKAVALIATHQAWAAEHGVTDCRPPPERLRPGLRHLDQWHGRQPGGRGRSGRPRSAGPRRPGAGHDVWPGRRALPELGPQPWRRGPRRPGHAGRTGSRGLRVLARRETGDRPGAGGPAREAGLKR